jgi:hypothetical protein
MEKKWDLFISHASEDKVSFVRPLVQALQKENISVWYDEFSISFADSLMESIGKGIRDSRFGLVVLSKHFFIKKWTKKEIQALFSKEILEDSITILPVWYQVSQEEVFNFSPLLSDKVAIIVGDNPADIENATEKIIKKVLGEKLSIQYFDNIMNELLNLNSFNTNIKLQEIYLRLENYMAYHNELEIIGDKMFEEIDDEDKLEIEMTKHRSNLSQKYFLSNGVHITEIGVSIKRSTINALKSKIKKWLNGKMLLEDCYHLYYDMDEGFDLDFNFILWGIPNYYMPKNSFDLTIESIGKIGSRKLEKRTMIESDPFGEGLSKYINGMIQPY